MAIEVFAHEVYRLPSDFNLGATRRVVDVGGNVGFTTLYWLRRLPNARVVAFEPHPINADCFRGHMRLNGLSDRVKLLPVAAGVRDTTITLRDCGSGSSHVINRTVSMGPSHEVRMVDWISVLDQEPIDLLKIDIEGGEYELLADPRFGDLRIRTLVMEWHKLPDGPSGREWCVEKLESLGFKTRPALTSDDGSIGMIWGFKAV